MSTQNLSELATRAQAGHILDSVEGQLLELPRGTAQNIIGRGLARYQELHRKVVETLVFECGAVAYPADGEIFELTLDGDAPENQPLEMVSRFGYAPVGWRHNGPKVSGKQTRRFKLVGVWATVATSMRCRRSSSPTARTLRASGLWPLRPPTPVLKDEARSE